MKVDCHSVRTHPDLDVARALAQAPPGPAAVQAEIADHCPWLTLAPHVWRPELARRLVAIGDPVVVERLSSFTSTD